jgi:hypothetical protein
LKAILLITIHLAHYPIFVKKKIRDTSYESEIKDLIKLCHSRELNHFDSKATVKKLNDLGLNWPGIENRVVRELKSCPYKRLIPTRSNLQK